MYIGSTSIQTAESENTGMTLYCGTGKELPESVKPQMPRSFTPVSSRRERRAGCHDQWTGQKGIRREREYGVFTDGAMHPGATGKGPISVQYSANKDDAYICCGKSTIRTIKISCIAWRSV